MFTLSKKTGFAALALAAMLALPAVAQAKDDVAATVNGEKIMKSDVMTIIKNSPAVKAADSEKVYPILVEQMINDKLIDTETVKAEIEKDPAFQQRLAAAKAQMVRAVYLEKYLKGKVTDGEVKDTYEKFKKENKGKKEAHARHILVASEDEAKKVIKDLDGGAKFDALAKERSSDPSAKNGGDVGWFAQGEIIPAFSDAAFALKPGSYTKTPVKSQFGYHVIYVEEFRTRDVPELKNVENTIRTRLGQEAIGKLVKDLRTKAKIERFDFNGNPVSGEGPGAVKKN